VKKKLITQRIKHHTKKELCDARRFVNKKKNYKEEELHVAKRFIKRKKMGA
jgi:hypothetical protein